MYIYIYTICHCVCTPVCVNLLPSLLFYTVYMCKFTPFPFPFLFFSVYMCKCTLFSFMYIYVNFVGPP